MKTTNTPHYTKYGELPSGFTLQFDKAYEAFWRRRNMEPPVVDWKSWNDKTFKRKKAK